MATVTITADGQAETFEFDGSAVMLSEAAELEKETGWTYGEWQYLLGRGSSRALAAFIWLVWRRCGRVVPLEDIISGKIEIDLSALTIKPARKRRARKAGSEGDGS